MRQWDIPPSSVPAHKWTDVEVLLSFNGPQIVLVDGGDGLYLSVASDEGPRSTRWLRARISPLERQALLFGATTVRECILKSDIWIVDTNRSGEPISEAHATAEMLLDIDLPSHDSFLPNELVAAHKLVAEQPKVFLDGLPIVNHGIGFHALADLLKQLQRLWDAIGQNLLGESTAKGPVPFGVTSRTELVLDGLVPGSVGLQLRPTDVVLFDDIARQYDRLVASSDDPGQLRSILRELKARVRATYADYLAVVRRHGVEVFTRWNHQGTYLSPTIAARVEPALDAVEGTQEERVEVHGYFNGFNLRDGGFEFVDPRTQERYQGRASARALRGAVRIVIGPSSDYVVELSILTSHGLGGSPRHFIELESIRSVTSEMMPEPDSARR